MTAIIKDTILFLKKRNVKRFFIAFLISFSFFIFSKLTQTYKAYITIALELKPSENDEKLLNNTPKQLLVYAESDGFSWLPYLFNSSQSLQLNANTHVSKVHNIYSFNSAKHKYMIEETLGSEFTVINIQPDSVGFEFYKLHKKKVPLQIIKNISYTDGYDSVKGLKSMVDSITLIGNRNALDTINYIETRPIVRQNIKENISETVILNVPVNSNFSAYPKDVTLEMHVERFTEGQLKIPVEILNVPESLRLNFFPKHVSVSYYLPLRYFNEVTIKDFKVICDFNAVNPNQNYLIPQLIKTSKYIKHVSIAEQKIDFIKL